MEKLPDPCDAAASLSQEWTDRAIKVARQMAQHHPNDYGTTCRQCGDDLPEIRYPAGICVPCLERLEGVEGKLKTPARCRAMRASKP